MGYEVATMCRWAQASGTWKNPSLSSCPYSPECVEEEFSEVHGSKQPLRRSGKHSTTAWWHLFDVETLRLGSSSCTIEYQAIATRNSATTREILPHRTGPMQTYTTP